MFYSVPIERKTVTIHKMTDKELISNTYKQLIQLNIRKTNHPIKKWAIELSRHLSKGEMQMVSRTAPLIMWEMQVRTTVRYHCTAARTTVIKKNTNVDKIVLKKKLLCTVDGI